MEMNVHGEFLCLKWFSLHDTLVTRNVCPQIATHTQIYVQELSNDYSNPLPTL